LEVNIKEMALEDLEAILEIEELSFPIPWSRNSFLYELLENERAIYLVAQDGLNRTIGYIGVWVVCDEGHITNLAVHPSYRRKGVAEQLLKRIIEAVRVRGVRHVTLEVRRTNLGARRLYEKLGFVHMGVRRKYYLDNNEDAFIMWKGPI